MANIQKLELRCSDYWDNEKQVFILYARGIIKSRGVLRVYDKESSAWWDSRIVSIKYMKQVHLYRYELEKL